MTRREAQSRCHGVSSDSSRRQPVRPTSTGFFTQADPSVVRSCSRSSWLTTYVEIFFQHCSAACIRSLKGSSAARPFYHVGRQCSRGCFRVCRVNCPEESSVYSESRKLQRGKFELHRPRGHGYRCCHHAHRVDSRRQVRSCTALHTGHATYAKKLRRLPDSAELNWTRCMRVLMAADKFQVHTLVNSR